MRVTLHAVSARDFASFWPAIVSSHRQYRARWRRDWGEGIGLDELTRRALAYASEPRTNMEMRAYLEALAGPTGERDPWWGIRLEAPFVLAPDAAPWAFGRPPRIVDGHAWVSAPFASPDDGLDHLVRSYLRGFGPATVGDIFQFTRLERPRLKLALQRLAPGLRLFRSEAGKLLYDVPDAALPPADTSAPVRFLPMWDSVLLAYEDRTRIIAEAYRRRVLQVNGDWLPCFLVDGYVAGLWRAVVDQGRTTIRPEPFEPLAPDVADQVADEAARLAAFVEPIEPAVYKRYATTWMK